MQEISFEGFGLGEPLMRALARLRFEHPTAIQAMTIEPMLHGRDIIGCAKTGTGKTAAFALPILQLLGRCGRPRPGTATSLILAPTRELAAQVAANFAELGRFLPLKTATVYGGVSMQPQLRACRGGLDVLVATPGRLLDIIGRGALSLGRVRFCVLDEADRMLDMGFIPDVRRIVGMLPEKRQSAFFSATMPPRVVELASEMLHEPVELSAAPQATAAESVSQRVMFVSQPNKKALLGELLKDREAGRVLVFTRTRHGADRVARTLSAAHVRAESIHGNKSQNARQVALDKFRSGRARVLVATDVAARGIDVQGVTHVINYDMPHDPESYVHRIGRTGRAEASGVAISFCEPGERACLRDIEKLIRQDVPLDAGHPYHLALDKLPLTPPPRPRRPKARRHYGGGWGGPMPKGRARSGRGARAASRP